jgi:HD domain
MSRAALKARAWVVGTCTLGAGVLVAALFQRADAPLATLALLGAAVVLTELIQVPADETSPDPGDAHSFSLSTGVHTATILIIGPWTGALVAAFGVIVADRLRGASWKHVAYNASVFALAAASAGHAYMAFGGTPGAIDLPGDFPPLAALAFSLYAVNTLLMSAVVSLDTGTPFRPLARDTATDGLPSAAGEIGFGVALAHFALTEPWAIVALAPLVLAVYRSYERLAALRRETAHALETFANVVDERDPSTFQHSARVAEYMRRLAHGLGLSNSEIARLRWAGRLHDLGKIAVDAAVLRKPDELDEAEWAAMRLHPRLSARLLQRFRFAAGDARAVEYHHERMDGHGYYGLDSREIPLAAHFLIVADSYDAMTSDRPYRKGLSAEVALAEIERKAGAQFHPAVAKAFVAMERGVDPLAALTDEERAEIRRLARPRVSLAFPRRLAALRLELVVAVGIVTALGAVGVGLPALAVPALAASAAGFGLARFHARRSARLAEQLHAVCKAPGRREDAFRRLVTELASADDVRWVGLLSWWERDCSGLLELQWSGGAQGPSETALTSWLIREAEAASEPVVAAGAELGRENAHLAVPLQRDGVLVGFLVLAVGRWPRTLVDALLPSAEAIGERLLPGAEPDTSAAPALRAIAG